MNRLFARSSAAEPRRRLRLAAVAAVATTASALYYYDAQRRRLLELDDVPKPVGSTTDRPSPTWTPPTRKDMLDRLKGVKPADDQHADAPFDFIVVGGGATGAGIALDAASRGLKVGLVERDDFSSGTSSKSTKLVHGGVRYLEKAIKNFDREQWHLVKEALAERKTFLHIAPYLSFPLPTMLPVYQWWKVPYYWAGCKVYDLLAGSGNLESSYFLSGGKALEAFPMLKAPGLCGALVYYDGQHNDSRMNMAIISTAVQYGATVANHVEVTELIKDTAGRIIGTKMRDNISGEEWSTTSKGVINATGPFTDGLRKLDDPNTPSIVAPSSGVHITLPQYYCPGGLGLIDPATSDGRVIFFLPWQGNVIAGTTDSPTQVSQNPIPTEAEIDWILNEVKNYLNPDIRVRRGDVLSAWSGIRPLVKDPDAADTSNLVRNHMINVSPSGLLTISGGKWTSYRHMAEDAVDRAIKEFDLADRVLRACVTEKLRLVGSHGWSKTMFVKLIQQFGLETDVAKHLTETYGDRAWAVCSMAEATGARWPVHGIRLDPMYPYIDAEVRWACRREYAMTAVDVIARRTRLSFLNAEAAVDALPKVIDILSQELGWDRSRQRQEFRDAAQFLRSMGLSQKRVDSLSLDAVRKGLHKQTVSSEDDVLKRQVFTAGELSQLKAKFEELDSNQDGRVDARDLTEAMDRLQLAQVPKETVDAIIREVDVNRDSRIEFQEFLDIAAGVKELSLTNAFSDIVAQIEVPAEPRSKDDKSTGAWWGKKIPVERSGGGT